MSIFKAVNPKILLASGMITFMVGIPLLATPFRAASLYFFLGGLAVIIWSVMEKKKK